MSFILAQIQESPIARKQINISVEVSVVRQVREELQSRQEIAMFPNNSRCLLGNCPVTCFCSKVLRKLWIR